MQVNGSFVATPFSLSNGNIQVYESGFSVVISTSFGLIVSYDTNHYVQISVPYTYQNATCGLCGNFNNHPQDDFRTRQGEVVSSDVVFANSWKAAGDDELGCEVRCGGLDCAACTNHETALYGNAEHCGILQSTSGPFAACHHQLPPQNFLQSCVYDLCVGGGYQPILCQALNVYASQCQQIGVQLPNWRRPGFCGMSLSHSTLFHHITSKCPWCQCQCCLFVFFLSRNPLPSQQPLWVPRLRMPSYLCQSQFHPKLSSTCSGELRLQLRLHPQCWGLCASCSVWLQLRGPLLQLWTNCNTWRGLWETLSLQFWLHDLPLTWLWCTGIMQCWGGRTRLQTQQLWNVLDKGPWVVSHIWWTDVPVPWRLSTDSGQSDGIVSTPSLHGDGRESPQRPKWFCQVHKVWSRGNTYLHWDGWQQLSSGKRLRYIFRADEDKRDCGDVFLHYVHGKCKCLALKI